MKTEGQKWGSLFRVAIVGGATLEGKELAEVLEQRNFPSADVKLLDDNESLGQLERVHDEVAVVQPVSRDQLENIDFTFFACREDFTRTCWKLAREAGSAIVDLSYALEADANAPVSSPWIERELGLPVSVDLTSSTLVAAHPAAVVIALLLLRAQKAAKVRRANVTVLEPVSEQGRRGMDEMHEQTVNLLSFQPMPMAVFGSQVAFNIVNRFGEEIQPTLDSIEHRITGHLGKLLGDRAPVPSVMLLQAPVFHAHTFSLYIELEQSLSLGDFSQAIAGEHVEIARAPEDAPSNVNVAGKDEILVAVRRDAVHENGFWLWAAADNLRVAAATAVECAMTLAAVRPHGKVQ